MVMFPQGKMSLSYTNGSLCLEGSLTPAWWARPFLPGGSTQVPLPRGALPDPASVATPRPLRLLYFPSKDLAPAPAGLWKLGELTALSHQPAGPIARGLVPLVTPAATAPRE